MPFIALMPLIMIPAALVMLLGLWALPRLAWDDQDRRWTLLLILTAIVRAELSAALIILRVPFSDSNE